MVLRLHRVTEEQWHRLAAARRAHELGAAPARSEIGAIEIELREMRDEAPSAETAPLHRTG